MASALNDLKLAMASTNEKFINEVVVKRNIAALDQIYTSDARILPPGGPMVSGRPAIKEFWSSLIEASNPKSGVLTSVDVMLEGEGAVEIGSAAIMVEPAGQASSKMEVKYVVYWRQEDSRWKWHVDIWNTNS